MSTSKPTHTAETGDLIEGPFEGNRVHESYFWQRPNGGGDLGYNHPDVLLRCARIFGGRVVAYRVVTHTTTTVHLLTRPGQEADRG